MKRIKDICEKCLKLRALQRNKKCRACNRRSGILECCRCLAILPIDLSFYKNGKDGFCKHCSGYEGKGGSGRYPKMPEDVKLYILELHKKRILGKEIAKITKYSPSMISKIIKNYGSTSQEPSVV